MQIGVISDSHNKPIFLDMAFERFKKMGIKNVFHLGDYILDVEGYDEKYNMNIFKVSGNCDVHFKEIPFKVVELEKIRFFLCHGHRYDVPYGLKNLIKAAKENNCTVALFGHTHRPFNNKEEGIDIINPGSISEPRGGLKKSFAIISICDNMVNAEIKFL